MFKFLYCSVCDPISVLYSKVPVKIIRYLYFSKLQNLLKPFLRTMHAGGVSGGGGGYGKKDPFEVS